MALDVLLCMRGLLLLRMERCYFVCVGELKICCVTTMLDVCDVQIRGETLRCMHAGGYMYKPTDKHQ